MTQDGRTAAECAPLLASIDWLEMSVKTRDRERFLSVLESCWGPEWSTDAWQSPKHSQTWHVAHGPLGVRVTADAKGSENAKGEFEPWISVRVPGEACRAIGTEGLGAVWLDLHGLGSVWVSRADLAFDDRQKRVSPRDFAEGLIDGPLDDVGSAWRKGVVTRVRPDNWNWDRRKGGCLWIGGRASDRKLRYYDKSQESEGLIDAMRMELQLRNGYATDAMAAVVCSERPWSAAARRVVAFVDVRTPQGARVHAERWARAEWWQGLVGDVRIAATKAPERPHVERWLRSLRKRAGSSFRVLAGVLGPHQAADYLHGDEALTREHRRRVDEVADFWCGK